MRVCGAKVVKTTDRHVAGLFEDEVRTTENADSEHKSSSEEP